MVDKDTVGTTSLDELVDEDRLLLTCCICRNLLQRPVLLDCLHSCCHGCMDQRECSTCPECPAFLSERGEHATEDSRRAFPTVELDARENLFVAGKLHRFFCYSTLLCAPCKAEGNRAQATSICSECSQAICDVCLAWHAKFFRKHSVRSASDADQPPLGPQCLKHVNACCNFCATCKEPKCDVCMRSCLEARHAMCDLGDKRVAAAAAESKEAILERLTQLKEISSGLSQGRELARLVQKARSDDIAEIKKLKAKILADLEVAFNDSVDSTYKIYDGIFDKVQDIERSIGGISSTLEFAIAYSSSFVSTATDVEFLDQHKTVLRRLSSFHSPVPLTVAAFNGSNFSVLTRVQHSGMVDALKECLGGPRWHTGVEKVFGVNTSSHPPEDVRGKKSHDAGQDAPQTDGAVNNAPSLVDGERGAGGFSNSGTVHERPAANVITNDITIEDSDSEQTGSDYGSSLQGPKHVAPARSEAEGGLGKLTLNNPIMPEAMDSAQPQLFNVGSATSSFSISNDCRDIAVVPNGNVILAGLKRGVLEYTCSGKLVTHWRPPLTEDGNDDTVSTLEVMADGRLAVGLIDSASVAILKRNSDAWVEGHRIMMRASPFRLAVNGGLVATAGACEVAHRSWAPGPYLDVVRIDDCQSLLMETLGYSIQGLAAIAHFVVVLSNDTQRSASGRQQYVADAYNYLGQRLWRFGTDSEACDVCASPSGDVLYIVQQYGDRVIAINGIDGQSRGHAMSGEKHGLKGPIRLSFAVLGLQVALAVLSAQKNVTIFPVT